MIKKVTKEVVTEELQYLTSDFTYFKNYSEALKHEISSILFDRFIILKDNDFDIWNEYIEYLESKLEELENERY